MIEETGKNRLKENNIQKSKKNSTRKKQQLIATILITAVVSFIIILFCIIIPSFGQSTNNQAYVPDTKLKAYDFKQSWENIDEPHKINLIITTECEIKSINFTLDFYNENKVIIRTIKDTKTDLKKNKTYAFKYTFETNEKKVYFTFIDGEIIPNTRDDIGDNGGVEA